MSPSEMIPLEFREYPADAMLQRAKEFLAEMRRRRSVRQFSPRPVDRAVIESCIATAATAPSGANQQPWRFVAVSSPALKQQIRVAAEKEEFEFYQKRATPEWLEAYPPRFVTNVQTIEDYLKANA